MNPKLISWTKGEPFP